jgi:hypothetical protein
MVVGMATGAVWPAVSFVVSNADHGDAYGGILFITSDRLAVPICSGAANKPI